MTIHSFTDIWAASNSLQDWMQSQDLPPDRAVMVAEMFIARLIAANATSPQNIEEKFSLTNRTLREFTAFSILQR